MPITVHLVNGKRAFVSGGSSAEFGKDPNNDGAFPALRTEVLLCKDGEGKVVGMFLSAQVAGFVVDPPAGQC